MDFETTHKQRQFVFMGSLSLAQVVTIERDLDQDCETGVWKLTEQPKATFVTCAWIARQHVNSLGLRTLDSLHVAAALELGATQFWTFDRRQARLAEAEGLLTAANRS